MDLRLLKILVCPICKKTLNYNKKKQELICSIDHVAFPIRENIPVMLIEEARKIMTNKKNI